MFNVDSSVDNWLKHVHAKEKWYSWENKSGPVSRESNVEHTVAFKGAEWLPPKFVCGFDGEGSLFLAEAWDIHVDAAL